MNFLCRHGETTFNREHRPQGHLDSDPAPLDVRQAEATADLLA